jgi:hypothetical protein
MKLLRGIEKVLKLARTIVYSIWLLSVKKTRGNEKEQSLDFARCYVAD